mmetsp:Transcript_14500/g.29661  ORF Transcript_14500/g.29661 Transcript_14500/m.29661 type:complete len:962 (+) Transcript_14500:124-3009(+)
MRDMADVRQRNHDDSNISKDTFMSVQNVQKECQSTRSIWGAEGRIANNDDESCMSMGVKERLKRYQSATIVDARQDKDQDESDNDDDDNDDDNGGETYTNVMDRYKEFQQERGLTPPIRDVGSVVPTGMSSSSVVSSAANQSMNRRHRLQLMKSTSRDRSLASFSPSTRNIDQDCFPPLTVSFQTQEENSSAKEGFHYGNVSLKKIKKPVEDRWKKNLATDSIIAVQADDDDESLSSTVLHGKKDDETSSLSMRRISLPVSKSELSKSMHTFSSSPSSLHVRKSFPNLSSSLANCKQTGQKDNETSSSLPRRKSLPVSESEIPKSLHTFSSSPSLHARKSFSNLSSSSPANCKQIGKKDEEETRSSPLQRISVPVSKSGLSTSPLHSSSSLHVRKSFLNTSSSPANCKQTKSLVHRRTSLLACVGSTFLTNAPPSLQSKVKGDLPSPSRPFEEPSTETEDFISENEKFQNDLAAALKKVGPPIEERWKLIKNCDEYVSGASKPSFSKMKLKSIGSTASATPTGSSRFIETRQYFNDQSTTHNRRSLSQNHEDDDDDDGDDVKEESLSPSKRHRQLEVATTQVDMTRTSKITKGDHDGLHSINTTPCKSSKGGISVSDLAKTFSSRIAMTSHKDELYDEKVSSESNEIEKIRNSLRSTAKELEGIRKSLNLSSPVAKLIAEKNEAVEANTTKDLEGIQDSSRLASPVAKLIAEKNMASEANGSVRDLQKNFAPSAERLRKGRRSFGSTNIKSLSGLERSSSDGDVASVQNPNPPCRLGRPCDPTKNKVEDTLERDIPDDFTRNSYWENPETDEDIFPLPFPSQTEDRSHDETFFSDKERVSPITSESSNNSNENSLPRNDELLQSSSTLSENTTDSEGHWHTYGENRYIQFTLSSGGITEKVEPNINIFMSQSVEAPSMASLTDVSSRKDRKKGLADPLKGAKKFFFGKNKRKTTEEESCLF